MEVEIDELALTDAELAAVKAAKARAEVRLSLPSPSFSSH
jgi:hypothetical protein